MTQPYLNFTTGVPAFAFGIEITSTSVRLLDISGIPSTEVSSETKINLPTVEDVRDWILAESITHTLATVFDSYGTGVLASTPVEDFDESLFSAVGNSPWFITGEDIISPMENNYWNWKLTGGS